MNDTAREYGGGLFALALEEKKRLEALSQAEALKTAARERIDEAIHIIVWEIVEKCQ